MPHDQRWQYRTELVFSLYLMPTGCWHYHIVFPHLNRLRVQAIVPRDIDVDGEAFQRWRRGVKKQAFQRAHRYSREFANAS